MRAPRPGSVRPLVAASWRRSASVDPDSTPEVTLGADELDAARRSGPLATLLPIVRRLLLDDSRAAGCIVAVGDAAGRLVFVDGARHARRAAEDMGFVAGADWAEEHVGTSAPGTALRLDRPVQIRSEEHYATAVKPFSCSAVPVHDTDGRPIGVVDVTGDDRAVERHTLPLLAATVAAAEAELALATLRRPDRGRTTAPEDAELVLLGADTAVLRVDGRAVALSARHSEILAVLATAPGGCPLPTWPKPCTGTPAPPSPSAPRSCACVGCSRRAPPRDAGLTPVPGGRCAHRRRRRARRARPRGAPPGRQPVPRTRPARIGRAGRGRAP